MRLPQIPLQEAFQPRSRQQVGLEMSLHHKPDSCAFPSHSVLSWKLKPLLSCHSPHSSGSALRNFTDRGDTTRTLPGTKVLFFPLKRDSCNIQLLKTPPTQICSPSRGDSLQSQQQLCTSPLTDLRWLHYQGPPYSTDAA